ncbi:NAD-dependent epimerase/dehydratase family protein [Nocardioides jiangxiensis]|uniref:NAD-dependent epimerase/dehydratase family protein n=1 Tax=Nocardioides jiangxiensis TaxID=3064524 RepID=A0ABT9AZ48_9ACTN|nr:NAD-dependent epimerase/dehydratase family protein [Nocardioides sp. WY-20]MDO7867860.1 NAD-dependent epimerase/dehydratase family protein [Nocardioides sp. WY-20]
MTDFWFGKRVLITGGDGFVASNLTEALMRRGAVVTITVRHQRPAPTSVLLNSELRPDVEVTEMRDYSEVQRIINRHQIDTIFHLAASAIVSDSARSPMSTYQNNIEPTLNLLEAARINGVERVLLASTDKSYGDHADVDDTEPLPYLETHALRGMDVYSSSKACADMMAQSYSFQYKLPALIVRSCNIYGPGDLNFTRLIPRTSLRMMAGKAPVINLGNADVLREYIYIDDLCDAYMFLAENMERHYAQEMPTRGRATYGWSSYNVGAFTSGLGLEPREFSNIRSVTQVIDTIGKVVGSDLEPVTIPKPDNFIEIPDQFLDSKKLHDFGYTPKIDFEEGVERSVEWYRNHSALFNKLGAKYVLS